MRERSAAAARAPHKGGTPNAILLAGAAEALDPGLDGLADEIRVVLPWGSLLRGCLLPQGWLADALCRVLKPGGRVLLVLSVGPRERALGLPELDASALEPVAAAWRTAGFTTTEIRPVDAADVAALGSAWARRLGIPTRRHAWWIGLAVGLERSPEVRVGIDEALQRPTGVEPAGVG
jgi:16S rRNA (adenine(1408)-N(1))-methyltransferase